MNPDVHVSPESLTHATIMTGPDFGRCSFVDLPVRNWTFQPGAVLPAEICGKPAEYAAQSCIHGRWGVLCPAHAAHVRACSRCQEWFAEIRTR